MKYLQYRQKATADWQIEMAAKTASWRNHCSISGASSAVSMAAWRRKYQRHGGSYNLWQRKWRESGESGISRNK